ncbi:DUF4157 domain-containing protein [Streptomyces sp900129855]|uniref:DUF4157 domain-containing protein n=1 Tax=Streptomyces sp. 900129855 TaxID=3155129 RepID=A0ABV2ZXR5_9ACTN
MHADRQRPVGDPDRGQGLPRRAVQFPATAAPQQAARHTGGLSPAAALSLQRAIGNAAVARLVESQRHQHSADCGHGPTVQRSAPDQTVQRDALDRVDAVTRTSGSPLQTDVRRRMESDYDGEDFSDVRVHVDRSSAEAVGAKAYTTKTHHIVFRSAADMDDHTMRHELQHVRQQREGGVPSGISDPTDAWERDAESAATKLGQRPAPIQRSTTQEQNHTPTPGVAVQRMPPSRSRSEERRSRREERRSRREERRGRSGSDCRIEGFGSGAQVRVSRSSSPPRSPHEETGSTMNTFWNEESVIGNQAGVIRNEGAVIRNLGRVVPNQGPVIHDETEPMINNYRNERSVIGNQAGVIRNQGTATYNLGPVIRNQGTMTHDETEPMINNYRNEGAVIRNQGAMIYHGGLYTRNFSGSAINSGEGNLFFANTFNLFDRHPAGDPNWSQEPNWEFNAHMTNSRGRRRFYGNSFNTSRSAIRFNGGDTGGGGAIRYNGGDTGGEFITPHSGEDVIRENALNTGGTPLTFSGGEDAFAGNTFDAGGGEIQYNDGGGVFYGNSFNPRGGEVAGTTFHMSSGIEQSSREGAMSPPTAMREESRAHWRTVLNFDGDFTVEGNASMFIGNFFDAGHYNARSRQQEGRSGEQGADYAAGEAFPDYAREDLYVGNVFNIRGGSITLSGGVYFRNSFTAERIIIRGNAVFVGGNSFHGEVEVENPDLVAQEIHVGDIAGVHADRVTPL